MTFWNTLDPKLKHTLVTAVLSYLILQVGLDLDPSLQAAVAGLVGAVSGYNASNDGTVLRTEQEDGNPVLPSEDVPPGGEDIV